MRQILKQTVITGILLALLGTISPASIADTMPRQIMQLVSDRVEALLKQQKITQQAQQRVSYEVSAIDYRLRLADCNEAIQVKIDPRKLLGRITTKVECRGSTRWSIYVPVTIKIFKPVVTARAPIARGELLTPELLEIREYEVSTLTRGYFSHSAPVLNKQLKRSVSMHGIISPNMLIELKAIKKGDAVMIVAVKGALRVRSPGVALSDGIVGQQIRVKNSASKRIVSARVKQKGLVEVII